MPSPFAILFSLCVVMIVIIAVVRDPKLRSEDRKPRRRYYEDPASPYSYEQLDKIGLRASDSSSIDKVKSYLDELEILLKDARRDGAPEEKLEEIRRYQKDVDRDYQILLEEKWEKKVDPIVDELNDCYEFVTMAYNHTFQKVEDVIWARDRCLDLFDLYWKAADTFLEENQCRGRIRTGEYLNRWKPEENRFASRWELQQTLDAAIEPLKPEQKRKKKLYRDILNWVAEREAVQQCVLLRQEFPNATAEEVKYCYKDLVKRYKLVKYKMGNRWFVMLSDKEKEQREKEAQKAAERKQKAQAAKDAEEKEEGQAE